MCAFADEIVWGMGFVFCRWVMGYVHLMNKGTGCCFEVEMFLVGYTRVGFADEMEMWDIAFWSIFYEAKSHWTSFVSI